MSWSGHVTSLCNVLSRNFNLFYNIRNVIPEHLKRQIYFSLVYSKIQYGIELYGSCSKTLLDRIQILQNKLLKVLYNLPYRTDTCELHSSLRILKVNDIRKLNILKFVYEALNRTSIKQFHSYYRYHRDIHNRNSRQNDRLYPERVRTKYGENTLNCIGSKLWNSLDQNIRNCHSLYTFKKAVRSSYITGYIQ